MKTIILSFCLLLGVTPLLGFEWDHLKAAKPKVRDTSKGIWFTYWSADKCPPCRAMQPSINRLIAEGWPVQLADYDTHTTTASLWGVTLTPSIVIRRNCSKLQIHEGFATYETLLSLLHQYKAVQIPPKTEEKPAATTPAASQPFRQHATCDPNDPNCCGGN